MMHQRLTSLKDLKIEDFATTADFLYAESEAAADSPERVALWEREVELEELMLATGRETINTATAKAKEKGTVSHLAPYRRLTELLIGPIAQGLKEWLHDQRFAPHVKAVAFPLLDEVPPESAAMIALRTLLDRVGSISKTESMAAPIRLLALALAIGSAVEAEARMVAWKAKKPGIWHAVQRDLKDNHATAIHRRRANVNRFNRQPQDKTGENIGTSIRDQIGWVDWTHDQRRHVGFRLIDMMVQHSKGRVTMTADPEWVRQKKNDKAPYIVSIDDDTQNWLMKALGKELETSPVLMPTVIKPNPWSDMWDGGYLTGILPTRSLIRFKADNVEQAKVAVQELSRVDMPRVYDAVNTIQEVPWRINDEVLRIAKAMWEKDLALAAMPRKEAEPLPFRAPLCDTNEDAQRMWRRAAAKVKSRNAAKLSRVKRVNRVMFIAETYSTDERFYFPYVLDFRGRMYSLPVDLQPQGEDLARGLLTFAEGKPLGETGAYWLAIHVANVWGKDKGEMADRIKWVTKNEAMFRRIAADPIKNNRWALPKSHPKGLTNDHWQALAATLEWVRYLDEGDTMVSALPVRLDGTCNGIQHLSAMVRDEVGGAAVNLVPGFKPRDIYTEVGAMVEQALLGLTDGDTSGASHARKWLEAVNGKLPRDVTKRPVMILPYGGTKRAYHKYTIDWMEEYDPEATIFPEDERFELARFLVDILWDEVEKKLPSARGVQKWLQHCAKLAASTNLPLRWTTPMGFVVRHFYGKPEGLKIETLIDGQRITLQDWHIGKDMSIEDQMRGIPPNFTHSMDGCVLMRGVNTAYNAGIDSITCIHDAYGTVAADVDMLNACIRDAFVWTYEHPVLEDFRNECATIIDDDINTLMQLPHLPKFGSLVLEDIRHAEYFIA